MDSDTAEFTAAGAPKNLHSDVAPTTFGLLGSDWRPLEQWASRHRVLEPVLRLIEVSLLRNRPDAFGSLLSVTGTQTAKVLLPAWANSNGHAADLHAIHEAVSWDATILEHFPPLGFERRAQWHFRGTVKIHYLAALCVARKPVLGSEVTAEAARWFEILRIWLVVQSLERQAAGIRLDRYLRLVCDKLRVATDEEEYSWLDPLVRLAKPIMDCGNLREFDRSLAFRAEGLRKLRVSERLSDGQDGLLRALIEIAQHHEAELDLGGGDEHLLPARIAFPPEERVAPAGNIALLEAGDDSANIEHAVRFEGVTAEDDAALVPTPQPTLTFQKLHARSVLLATAEELHYLPWSWSVPTEEEVRSLEERLVQLSASETPADRLLAALIQLTLSTGRSLRRVLEFEIARHPKAEWTILAGGRILRRKAPRRYAGWRPKSRHQLRWIRPRRRHLDLPLPRASDEIFAELVENHPDATCLGDLWLRISDNKPEHAFDSAFGTCCPRVTPGMLGRRLGVALFRATRDATLTRLVSAHPASGLPGACAYPAWSSDQLMRAVRGACDVSAATQAPSDDNALGSLLAVLEAQLPNAFRTAAERVTALRERIAMGSNDKFDAAPLIRFHNAFVGYLTVLLLAATGARPVSDPFESITDFNFENCFVFTEDKASGEALSGRLIPLPRSLCDYIHTAYQDHLRNLAAALRAASASLPREILQIARGNPSACMPFLFFLTESAGMLNWASVTEARLDDLQLFDWPLPFNLFRHRLATELRVREVEPEIIDAILGHAENGAETHGDDSWRVWHADMKSVRRALDQTFAVLGAPLIYGLSEGAVILDRSHLEPVIEAATTRAYGRAGRRERRRARVAEMKTDARDHLKRLIAGRRIADLTREDLDAIGTKLLLNPKGMPHPAGWLKYQHFLNVLSRYGRLSGKRLRPGRRYVRMAGADSPFTDMAPVAQSAFVRIRQQLNEVATKARTSSYRQAALFGTLLVCTESRVCDVRLLNSLLLGRDFRLTRLNGRHFLEYAPDLDIADPDAPVRRHRIGNRVVRLLAKARGRKNQASAEPLPVPAALRALADEVSALSGEPIDDCTQLIRRVGALVDQVNVMTLPGVLAAWLAGRAESWCLPWRDWMRLVRGKPYELPGQAPDDETDAVDEALPMVRATADAETLITEAAQFLSGFRKQIGKYRYGERDEDLENTAGPSSDSAAPTNRRDLRRLLLRLIGEHSGRVSPTILLLHKWAASHVTRKLKGRYIALSSVLRYLSALSPAFIEVAFDNDIRVSDEEEITELYERILETGELDRPEYRHERLQAFHRWCSREHDLPQPDWSELPLFGSAVSVSPGIILETEYLAAIDSLMATASPTHREHLAPAFLLFCCYRFGLRRKEAIGLARNEWLHVGRHIQIIVQSNRYRTLKTAQSSRRVVPLLFPLAPQETALLQRWLGQLEAVSGGDRSAPIFSDDAGRLLDVDRVGARAIEVLKRVTGNPDTVLHHARHTAGTAVALALADLDIPGITHLPAVASRRRRSDIQKLLLGFPGVTRRSPWALARFFGHAGTATARKCYLHFLGDWADRLIGVSDKDEEQPTPEGVVDLDALSPKERAKAVSEENRSLAFSPGAGDVLKFMRLLSRGHDADAAGSALCLPSSTALQWGTFLDRVDRKLLQRRGAPLDDGRLSHRFLKHITEDGWRRLLDLAASVEEPPHRPSPQSASTPIIGRTEIAPELVVSMIGATRQLVMWKVPHFELLRKCLDYWRIDADKQIVVGTREVLEQDPYLRQLSLSYGFNVMPQSMGAGRVIQIDSARDGERGELKVARRCAILSFETADRQIRTSYESLVAFVAFCLSQVKP